MRLLFVTPWLPHPNILHAGGQYVYHTLRWLAQRHEVHLLSYGRGESADEVEAIAPVVETMMVIEPAYTVRHIVQPQPDGWQPPKMLSRRTQIAVREYMRVICSRQNIEAVHFAWTEMGRYMDAVPDGVAGVLGTMDVEYLVRPREAALRPSLLPAGLEFLQVQRRAHSLIHSEADYLPKANVVLACSAADKQHLAKLTSIERIHVVRPWIDAEAVRHIKLSSVVPGRLTFVGALDSIPNIVAARFFVDEVWPIIRAQHPETTLHIVGANPTSDVQAWATRDPRIVVSANTAAIPAAWAETDVAVSPSLIGGGLIPNVTQAMAAGRPVVTTTLGYESVDAPPELVDMADTAPEFADAVLRLLSDRTRWQRRALAGRAYISRAYDWDESMQALENAYEVAIASVAGQGKNRFWV
ncbi:MAG: glycosyltransferase [Burkholderiales bacterium]|nr:glycosyltransferase [Anaerolineae bacterium]